MQDKTEAPAASARGEARSSPKDMAARVGGGLFLLIFLTGLDRYLALRGYLPISGAAAFFALAAVILGAALFTGLPRTALLSRAADILRLYRPFWLVFLFLTVFSIGYWFRRADAAQGDLTFLAQPFLVCAAAALLPLVPSLRRDWRTCVRAAFALYCLTVWADALWPGTFAEYAWRPAGLAVNANAGALLIIILAAPLLMDRRLGGSGRQSLLILLAAGCTVSLSLSRGGILLYLALFCCYFVFRRSPRRRLEFFGASALLLVICPLSIWSLPAFQSRDAADRLTLLAAPQDWLSFRIGLRRPWRIAHVVSRYDNLGSVQAASSVAPPPAGETSAAGTPEAPADNQSQAAPSPLPPDVPPELIDHRSVRKVEDGRAYLDTARVVRYRNAWDTIRASPWAGYGTRFNIVKNIGAHNMFLAMWVDFGIVGALAYPVLLFFAFLGFYRRQFWPGVCLAVALAGAGLFSDNIFDWRPLFLLTGLLLGLSAGEAGEMEQDSG